MEIALAWARSKIGVQEDPAGSARGPEIDEWQLACGLIAQPWCGAFVAAALREAGLTVPDAIVWVPNVLAWARAGDHGFTLHEWPARSAGDLVVFNFTGERDADHIGLLDGDLEHTIEGNTTVDGTGGETTGGVVARRRRSVMAVVGCARPPW